MNRCAALIIAVAGALLPLPAAIAQEGPGAGTKTQDNSNLAERVARRIEKKVAAVRGLEFRTATTITVYSRKRLLQFVKDEMGKDISPVKLKGEVTAHAMLNLLPMDFDLKSASIDLLGEQIGGFYDPEKKALVLVQVAKDDAEGHALHEVIMSHELVHALQDQHFDLSSLGLDEGHDKDRGNAIRSLVEGDATLMMMFFSIPGVEDPDQIAEMLKMSIPMMPTTFAGLAKMAEMAKQMGQDMDMGGGGLQMDSLSKAPALMSDEMCFSYMGGLKFVFTLFNATEAGGTQAIDAAFLCPPLSTEQILHPKKYTSEPDWPVRIELPDLSAQLGKGSGRLYSNNLGELHVRTFLTANGLKRISRAHSGWDGDRLELYTTPKGPGIVWYSRWDSEKDAEEFEAALGKIVVAWGQEKGDIGPAMVVRKGTDVILLRGFAKKLQSSILVTLQAGVKVEDIMPWKRELPEKTNER